VGGDVIAEQLIHRRHRQQRVEQLRIRTLGCDADQLGITRLGLLGIAGNFVDTVPGTAIDTTGTRASSSSIGPFFISPAR
jgi:hypothetical protein